MSEAPNLTVLKGAKDSTIEALQASLMRLTTRLFEKYDENLALRNKIQNLEAELDRYRNRVAR